MMTGELIWGPSFLEEIMKPHSDPEIRKIEEMNDEFMRKMLLKMFLPRQFDNSRYLPDHYKGKK